MALPHILTAYVLPLGGATLAGGLVGLERELRGHPAGLRTHTLLCLTSALLMVAATHQFSWLGPDTPAGAVRIDPARMAHGILTGIGFLCGGVIFRQGLSVQGVTTAMSLWVAATLGILFGVGAFGLAVTGAAAAILVLVGFRLIDQSLPESHAIDLSVAYRRDGPFPEDGFRDLLRELGLRPQALRHRLLGAEDVIEIGTTLRGPSGDQTGQLVRRLNDDRRVVGYRLDPASTEP